MVSTGRAEQPAMRWREWGLIAAMPAEAASWQSGLAPSGVGPEAARAAAERLVAAGVNGLISWGTSGALAPHLPPGALLAYEEVIDATDMRRFNVDAAIQRLLLEQLRQLGCRAARAVSCATPLASASAKERMRNQFLVDAVDLESAAVAAVASEHGLPFGALRAVVDPSAFSLPASALAALAAPMSPVLATLASLARHPLDTVPLLRLAWWYRRALRQLARAAALLQHAGDTGGTPRP